MVFGVDINYVAVLVATIVSFIFGFLWYGPIFGKTWAKENKIKKKKNEKMPKEKLLYQFLVTLVMVFCFSFLIQGSRIHGLLIAVAVWLGFLVSNRLGSMLWMKQSWKILYIDGLYHLANLVIIVVVFTFF